MAPDIVAGKNRAAVCFACHGSNGISKIPGTPNLANQDRTYLENAIRAYKESQTRQSPAMNAMAKPLSDEDITNIAAYFSLLGSSNKLPIAMSECSSESVIPNSQVSIAQKTETSSTPARIGSAIYQSTCQACHSNGSSSIPQIGNKKEWKIRLAKGTDVLIQHAIQGFNAMPPNGTCFDCSETEIKGAVEYIVTKSK
jgi:cytochrome c5